jgi:hypothetical protein
MDEKRRVCGVFHVRPERGAPRVVGMPAARRCCAKPATGSAWAAAGGCGADADEGAIGADISEQERGRDRTQSGRYFFESERHQRMGA